ncbi:unnamed protein product [Urochloa humidicola]
MKTAIYTAVGAWYRQSVTATIAAIMAEPGKVVVPWRQWAFTNLSSLWFVLPPLASLLAAYAPRRLFRTYFNLFLRRLLNVVDPYATVDISEPGAEVRCSRYGPRLTLPEDARELRAEGAKDGDGLVVSIRDGQDVADDFRGAPFWWSSVVDEDVQEGRRHKRRFLRLTFHLRDRRLVVGEYLPHVRRGGREILFCNRRRRLYTNNKSIDYQSTIATTTRLGATSTSTTRRRSRRSPWTWPRSGRSWRTSTRSGAARTSTGVPASHGNAGTCSTAHRARGSPP